jgi:hypothetical protein
MHVALWEGDRDARFAEEVVEVEADVAFDLAAG